MKLRDGPETEQSGFAPRRGQARPSGARVRGELLGVGSRTLVNAREADRLPVVTTRLQHLIFDADDTLWSPYARVLVRDDAGRKAWTNPVWFDGAK